VPYDEALMLWDYTRYDTSQSALLEVRALGTGRVLLNGRRVENWDGVLPRSLFFYLIDRGMTTRADIFQTFWPTLSVREATNVFHVTKRKISEVLGMDLTVYWSGYYHIAPHIQLSYDAALFSQATQDAAILPVEESGTLLRQAITLYRGHFLTSIDMDWTRKRREELLFNFNEALMGLARVYECHHQPQKALALYLQAAATNVQREDLVHNMMRLYSDMGKAGEALLLYERLREELQQTLGVEPAPQLQALAASIQQKSGAAV
jgi:two-component SAPR family response regulator